MKMNQKQLERWAKTRQKGRTRYVWFNGMLCWGVTTGVFWSLGMAFMQGWDRLPLLLAVSMIGFPIGGIFFGLWTWKTFEKQFQEANGGSERRAKRA